MMPKTLGITLDDALAAERRPEAGVRQSDPQVRELIDIARKLEGTNRNAGTHAAGVVIANGPLTDYVPLQRVVRKGEDAGTRSGEAVVTTQWVMGDLEKVGMLKMDFLGLRTLTLLDNAVRLIEKTRGEKIDLYKLPLDDPETYQLLQRGDAKGVFQFESDGIRELLKRLQAGQHPRHHRLHGPVPSRPARRRHGGRLRQLQARPRKAGLSASDHGRDPGRDLRSHGVSGTDHAHPESPRRHRAVQRLRLHQGHQQEEARDHRRAPKRFHQAAPRNAASARRSPRTSSTRSSTSGATASINLIAAAYAYVTYQTAYLKTHYTPEFMAALLSSEIEDGNKRDIMVDHIADARKLGVEVLPPDVNLSDSEFTVHDGKIVFGLTAIKGVGRSSSDEIVRARNEGGPIQGHFRFLRAHRSENRQSSATIERLIKAGRSIVSAATARS